MTINTAIALPTGEQANPNKVVDIPGGDKQTDVEIGLLYDRKIGNRLTLSSGVSYTIQFADHIDTRIPFREASKSSPDFENDVARDLGDIAKVETALKYSFAGLNIGGGYSFQYKSADKYDGSEFAAERYDFLAKDSAQQMHSAQFSIGADTITLFKAKKFFAPMGIDLTYTNIFAGKNVVSNSLTTLSFKMFF